MVLQKSFCKFQHQNLSLITFLILVTLASSGLCRIINFLDVGDFKVQKISGNLSESDLKFVEIPFSSDTDISRSKLVVYIHGYFTANLTDGMAIKNAFFEGVSTDDVDLFALVDWRKWSLPLEGFLSWRANYKDVALTNVPIVAEKVAEWLVRFKDWKHIYLIGFGMGAHIAGTAARLAAAKNVTINRITALDPAGPIFEHSMYGLFPVNNSTTLRSSDATFVDVLHASSILGMSNPVGHLDTYLSKDDCWTPSCTHLKAVEIFISSLTECSQITCPSSGECTPDTISDFGYLADQYSGRGVHKLNTLSAFDMHGKPGVCSSFNPVHLKARERICRNGSNWKDAHPYLTEYSNYTSEKSWGPTWFCKVVCTFDHRVRLRPNERLVQYTNRRDMDRVKMGHYEFCIELNPEYD